jgi:hypothetical protein
LVKVKIRDVFTIIILSEQNDLIMTEKSEDFSLDNFSLREFETFLILLAHNGKKLSVIKRFIDKRFNYKSRTKGYDYINALCKNGKNRVAYKKTEFENGKNVTRVFVKEEARKNYETFILPTITNMKIANENLIKKIKEISSLDTIREKFRNYTETIIDHFKELERDHFKTTLKDLKDHFKDPEFNSAMAMKNKKFLKKIEDTIWGYFRAEMLKYEFFSQ